MTRVIFFTFAGREANMEIQRPYIEALLEKYPTSEFHLWDLTREEIDQRYIRDWATNHPRVAYVGLLHPGHPFPCRGDHRRGQMRCTCMKHKPPYEDVYRYYRDFPHRGSRVPDYNDDTVFVKFDDDVLWMDVDKFDDVMQFLETNPDQIASANVVNNAVCAKYEPELRDEIGRRFGLRNMGPDFDKAWWALHMSPDFARTSHQWFAKVRDRGYLDSEIHPFRTREGESISINFVAMKYPMLKRVANAMGNGGRLGDEGTIDSFYPWIIPTFRVAHLTFGPQDAALGPEGVAALRDLYTTPKEG